MHRCRNRASGLRGQVFLPVINVGTSAVFPYGTGIGLQADKLRITRRASRQPRQLGAQLAPVRVGAGMCDARRLAVDM